jgi:hypothetical protein
MLILIFLIFKTILPHPVVFAGRLDVQNNLKFFEILKFECHGSLCIPENP